MLLFKYLTHSTLTSKSFILSDSKFSIHVKDIETSLVTRLFSGYIRETKNYRALMSTDV